jgi:hypothetical protein
VKPITLIVKPTELEGCMSWRCSTPGTESVFHRIIAHLSPFLIGKTFVLVQSDICIMLNSIDM